MLDFIWTLPAQLWGTRNKWTSQKILIHGRIRTTNSGTSCFPACTSNPSATETVDDLILELLQYLLTLRYYKNSVPCAKGYTENEYKRIAYLQSGDWYHLNTRWITQKKKFIMSYVSLQYIIFILFYLLLSILSVSEFVSLYYIFVTIKGNKSYKYDLVCSFNVL